MAELEFGDRGAPRYDGLAGPRRWLDAVSTWVETTRERRAARREWDDEARRLDWWRAH